MQQQPLSFFSSVDPCEPSDACGPNAICKPRDDNEEVKECICVEDSGYELDTDGWDCVDINECFDGSNDCSKNTTTCENTDGGYKCNCKDGYEKEVEEDKECVGEYTHVLFELW